MVDNARSGSCSLAFPWILTYGQRRQNPGFLGEANRLRCSYAADAHHLWVDAHGPKEAGNVLMYTCSVNHEAEH